MKKTEDIRSISLAFTLSRTSRDEVLLFVRDKSSRIQFLEVTLSLEALARLITGMAEVEAEGTLRNPANVGKQIVTESRTAHYPTRESNRTVLSKWLMEDHQEEGWMLDVYLGSKDSISYLPDGTTRIKYSVYRYLESNSQK